MGNVSQSIITATDQLGVYAPPLRGYLLSNLIHPVYRLSKAPVSDETPFAGESPAITASQTSRQLSLLRRRVASYHCFADESPAITASQTSRQLSLLRRRVASYHRFAG